MKALLSITIFCFLLTSCSKTFVQVFDTSTSNSAFNDGFYVYETDTLRIIYSFWEEHGVLAFAVFNKSNQPIYIDWRNSSFIYNSNKLNYWIDEEQTNQLSYYGGYSYRGPMLNPGFALNKGFQNSVSFSSKPERITFIPPKSSYNKSSFYLFPSNLYTLKLDCETTTVNRNDNPSKQTNVYREVFDSSHTPLTFRNYLAFSFSENSTDFFFVDNEFHVSSVTEMDYRHFRGKKAGRDQNGQQAYEKPVKKHTSFYIVQPKHSGYSVHSVEYRRSTKRK